jgi:hypothetical protein
VPETPLEFVALFGVLALIDILIPEFGDIYCADQTPEGTRTAGMGSGRPASDKSAACHQYGRRVSQFVNKACLPIPGVILRIVNGGDVLKLGRADPADTLHCRHVVGMWRPSRIEVRLAAGAEKRDGRLW